MKSTLISMLSVAFGLALLASASAQPSELPFDELSMRFEVNETDGDGEVVFSLKGFEGLRWLKVLGPDARLILFLISSDERRGIDPIGLAQFRLETGEPSIDGVQAAYPEGTYQFRARTVGGDRLYGEAVLSHARLMAPVFSPHGADGIDPNNAVVEWQPVEGAAAYEVEIENDDLDVNVTARLPGNATRFNIPPGFLRPGTEYEVGVATITSDGNVSVAESAFVTAD